MLFIETKLRTLPFTKSFIEIEWLVDFRKDSQLLTTYSYTILFYSHENIK